MLEATAETLVRVEVWREDTTTMDAQRQKSGGGRRRRRKARAEPRASAEPVLIAARRPNSPKLADNNRKGVAASAAPTRAATPKRPEGEEADKTGGRPARRRSARIVQVAEAERDEREKLRQRLLQKVMLSEGRGAISRAAEEYREHDFEFPEEQEVQLQLLEHFNEARARDAVETLERLLQHETPVKRPVLDQRLRRLEEYADEPATRQRAAALRRAIRV